MPIAYKILRTASCLFFLTSFLLANSHLSAQSITSCVPNSAPAGATVNVTITGTGVNFNSGTAIVNLRPAVGANINATNYTITSDSTMDALINVPSSATLGDYDMRVGFSMPYSPAVFAVTSGINVGTLEGKVFHDVNEDCFQGGTEPDLSGFVVHVTPGNYYAMTNNAGDYQALLPPGPYTMDVIPPKHYSRLCPAGPISATIPATGTVSSGHLFAMDVDTVTDGSISCGSGEFRPGFNTIIYVTVQNPGILPLTGTAQLVLDTNLIYASSNPVGSQSGDTISWSLSPAIPAGGIEIYQVYVTTPIPVPLGTMITNQALLLTGNPDIDPKDNTFACGGTVIGSYDPNDKTVWNEDMVLADPGITALDSVLIYRIRFQNTGTASAINIFVRDTLDANLDPGSLQMLGTSHLPVGMSLSGQGAIEWRFPDIHLPDSNSNEPASHGFILFKIKTKPGFTTGMAIKNKAHIYFDFNAPIVTNETNTSIIVSREDPVEPALFKVYPNPASELLHVEVECRSGEGVQYQLMDAFGTVVSKMDLPCQGGIQRFEVSVQDLSAGVYFLQTTVGELRGTRKIAITR